MWSTSVFVISESVVPADSARGLAISGQVAYLVYRLHSVLDAGLPLVHCMSRDAPSVLEYTPGLNCLDRETAWKALFR